MKRGRPREFDKTEALDQAMVLFWRNGYRGVSMDDLTSAMGITRPSLYAAFGDKEALFLSAVDHYRAKVIIPPFMQLRSGKELKKDLSAFFAAVCDRISDPTTPGCFIACMLSQESLDSEAIKAKLTATFDNADLGFGQILNGQRDQLRDGVDPDVAAQLLVSVMHGLSIRARSGASKEELTRIGSTFIDSICK